MSESHADGDEAEPSSEAPAGPEISPRVDMALHGITVSVTGGSDDGLDAVEESARSLMDYLVEKNEKLEDDPDEYGLS